MKVRTVFTFEELQLRTIRAALGRGGKATRKECVTFIDRAVRAALDKAPNPKPAKRMTMTEVAAQPDRVLDVAVEGLHAQKYPHGCPRLCEACAVRLAVLSETDKALAQRERIKGMYRTAAPVMAEEGL